ncbi:MAG: polysaccharide pyruvyl transferase family protein [Clostridia bacterium]|nr:polysaccharide pyruvyl transferase family protein [Clostridia bacterium]
MKIGILTYHRSINNGAVIQCYSLAKRLKKEFNYADVEVIDYHMPIAEKNYSTSLADYIKSSSIYISFKKMCKLLIDPLFLVRLGKRKKSFAEVLTILPLSNTKIFENDTKTLFDFINDNYDVVIAGSDAIWNYNMRGFPNPYFLDDSIKSIKFSYAASCYGMCYENISEYEKNRIREILDSYSYLGVRDDESEFFVDYLSCKTPKSHTCDPTVFLDVNDLPIDIKSLEAKMKIKGFDFKKTAIAIMGSSEMCKMVRKMYGKKYQIVALYNYCKNADVNLYDISPYEWAYVFRYFKLTFTTYFHGTLLSLRNGTPVICVALETDYSKNHTTKVQDFLHRLNMDEFYFHTDYNSLNIKSIKKKSDYLLNNDISSDILSKMDKEAKTADLFFEQLRIAIK